MQNLQMYLPKRMNCTGALEQVWQWEILRGLEEQVQRNTPSKLPHHGVLNWYV